MWLLTRLQSLVAANKPRVLVWDIENSHNLLLSFDLKNDNYIPHGNIVTERYIFCISYKWLGEKKIHTISILDDQKRFKKDIHDDFHVVSEFRKVIEQADAMVYHNGDRFDLPMFNGRLVFHGLAPLPKIPSIDTKKVAYSTFRFNSNRLDYLAKFLGYKGKTDNPSSLWIDCFMGDVEALKHMAKYNKNDIDINEFVYNKLSPFIKNNKVNMNMFMEGARCPNCGGTQLQWRGYNRTRTQKYRRFQCQTEGCMAWGDERKAVKDITVEVK